MLALACTQGCCGRQEEPGGCAGLSLHPWGFLALTSVTAGSGQGSAPAPAPAKSWIPARPQDHNTPNPHFAAPPAASISSNGLPATFPSFPRLCPTGHNYNPQFCA